MNKWQDHFVFEGKTYYTGTVFKVKEYEYLYGVREKEATFVAYSPEYNKVQFQIGPIGYLRRTDMLKGWIVSVTESNDATVKAPVLKKRKDSEIDGLTTGWIWYIVLMAVSTIFNGNVVLWALWSWMFFSWRHEKIKKHGYYYDWNS